MRVEHLSFPFRATLLFYLLFILCPAFTLHAETLTINSETQYAFAESCFKEQLFEQAANEFRRFVYFFPQDARTGAAKYNIGVSYCRLGRFQEAEEAFKETLAHLPKDKYYDKAQLMIGECRQRANDIHGAIEAFYALTRTAADASFRDQAWYRLAWLSIETASWQNARAALENISPEGQKTYHADDLVSEIDSLQDLPQKSPTVAGMFSAAIPGSGHLYCSRYQDALIAFFINAALIGAAWEAFDQDLPWLGGVISLVETGIYSGTIYSAVGCAHKANRMLTERHINRLKRRLSPELSFGPAQGGFQLAFHFDF